MSKTAQKAPGTGGGSVAIRGFLAQTLVALLEMAQAEPPFIEITLEPAVGDEQFDFMWTDPAGTHATQVKSTRNTFEKSDADAWAAKLEAARSGEECRLMLVGNIPRSLDGIDQIGAVKIEKRNLHLGDLHEQAAQRLAKFLEAEGLPAGTGLQRELVVHALVSKLEHLAERSKPLSREAFLKLLREWIHSVPLGEVQVDLSHFDVLKYAPAELIGRYDELKLLNDAWTKVQNHEKSRPHLLTFVALGGEGKTSLVAKWAAELAAQDWPGCDAAFAWSFYSQGSGDQQAASSDLFLKEALVFFGDHATAESNKGAYDKGRRLAQLCAERRSLLILDGLEPLQYAPSSTAFPPGQLKDQGIGALLKGLATASHGLCVVTTRCQIPDLKAFKDRTVVEKELKRLSKEAGVYLLQQLGVRKESGSRAEFETLVEDVKGHALTLTLLGGFLKRAFRGDIRQHDRVKFEKADEKMDGGHAFRTMVAYEQWLLRDGGDEGRREVAVLRLMGLFDRPADAGCLNALLQAPAIAGLTEPLVGIAEEDWNFSMDTLASAKLLTVNSETSSLPTSAFPLPTSLDAHPHLREYFARQLRTQQPDAWRAAHRRLYEHLCTSTPDKPQPTLEDLQPLYQAVAHGCQAGLQQEALRDVYDLRITRQEAKYATRKLGAFGSDLGAVTCFFETQWSNVTNSIPEPERAWLFNQSAFRLRALGRLKEALEPMKMGLEMRITQKAWGNAATVATNLSELELTLGSIHNAVSAAERCKAYAELSGDLFVKIMARSGQADAFLQAGDLQNAAMIFREAEEMQAKREPAYPQLRSLAGFQYCDLLVTACERGAWQLMQQLELSEKAKLRGVCDTVYRRVKKMRKSLEDHVHPSLSDFAFVHHTIGRTALYEGILDLHYDGIPNGIRSLENSNSAWKMIMVAAREFDAALDDFRRFGTQEFIVRGLLTRAWQRFLTAARIGPESAQEDLDEAWEIAERGPMRLFMADIHLYRARLFGRKAGVTSGQSSVDSGEKYPWESPAADLAAAEKLINACGYHRRDEELADAKRAILGS